MDTSNQERAVTLEEVLANRENRVKRQNMLRGRWRAAMISFCVNMPGPSKNCPEAAIIFRAGLKALQGCLERRDWDSPGRYELYAVTGPEALIGVYADPVEIKKELLKVENGHPLGRLFDFDVLDERGAAVSRADLGLPARRCLVCGEAAAICGRSRRHSLDELLAAIRTRTARFRKNT